MRHLTYSEAISEATWQMMEQDENIFVIGEGVNDDGGIFKTTLEANKKFPDKVFDCPLSENAVMGVAIGAAIMGFRPIVVHARNDFLMLAMDQIVNHAAKWKYMFGGAMPLPIVIRTIIGRSWGQGAQQSQSFQSIFMHIPGLKVVIPSNSFDAKGLLIASIQDDSPVVFIEIRHRWLEMIKSPVPERKYAIPLGKANALYGAANGKDATIVAISHAVYDAIEAGEELAKQRIKTEIIDPRTLKPLDEEMILSSVKKTGRLVISDTGWLNCGASAEIAAMVAEKGFSYLKAPIQRIGLADSPAPCSWALEKEFYPAAENIVEAVKRTLKF